MWKSWKPRGMAGNEVRTDYDSYRLTLRETAMFLIQSAVMCAAFSWLFYQSAAGLLAWPAAAVFRFRKGAAELRENRKKRLRLQFKDAILAAAASMQAGYSIENAFMEAEQEIISLYGRNSEMAGELSLIRKSLKNRIPLEQPLLSLGVRSHVEEIRDFTEVFSIAKRSGGNLKEIVSRTVSLTEQRMEVEREIDSMLASKKYEQKVMNYVPFLLFGYIQISARGYFDVLYHNATGIVIMTFCLCLYLISCFLAEKMIQIQL